METRWVQGTLSVGVLIQGAPNTRIAFAYAGERLRASTVHRSAVHGADLLGKALTLLGDQSTT